MRSFASRPRLSLAALALASALLVAASAVSTAANDPARDPIPVRNFLIGLGCWESGGRYDQRNPVSGAYGKYQIMPSNWPSWARTYIGRGRAAQTPVHQEMVARGKVSDLYRWRGSWPRVAYWWLTGSRENDRSRWSPYASNYVDGIMALARRSMTAAGRRTIPDGCFSTPPGGSGGGGGRGGGGEDRPTTPSSDGPTRIVSAYILNVRSGPSLAHEVIDGLPRGRRVAVVDRTRDGAGRIWLKVRAPGDRLGWVAGWWTRPAD